MSLRLITGRAGAGKTETIRREAVQASEHDPFGSPIFVLVPDQMSFMTEYNLSTADHLHGIIRVQATTFKQLAWRILQEVGGISRQELNGYGYRMFIRKLLEEHGEAFSVFGQAAKKRGFTEQMEQLLKEFSRYCLDCERLTSLTEEMKAANAPMSLQQKAHDLQVILQALEERLGTYFIDSEGYYTLLSKQIAQSTILKEADIYIDGFVTMTTREFEIIGELMRHAKRVTIALPIEDEEQDLYDETSIFHQAAKTAARIKEMASQHGVPIETSLHLDETKRFHNDALRYLEAHLDVIPPVQTNSNGAIRVIEAENPRAEVHAIARHIRRLMQEDGLRYHEMAILYREPSMYDELLDTTFTQYDIPLFLNRKKPMLHHPLIELSRSVLESVISNFAYEPMFRTIKTDLFFPQGANITQWREMADRLENFVLEKGIYGERWFDSDRWFVKKYRGLEFQTRMQTDEEKALQDELEVMRDTVMKPLHTFAKKLDLCATGREVATALFEFMESLHVYEKLMTLKDREEANGQLLLATEHEQAWQNWIDVLDQFVLMFGGENVTPKEALDLLNEGFDVLEFSRIPPALDQVQVATVDLARLTNIKVAFVIGVKDGLYPKRIEEDGLLSDSEREWFQQIGIELAPTSKMRLLDENYTVYRAVTTASEKLFLSYPLADEEGKAVLPSIYFKRFAQLFPDLETEFAAIDPERVDPLDLSYVSHPRAALPFYASFERFAKDGEELSPVWQQVGHYYDNDPLWKTVAQRVLRPLERRHNGDHLSPDVTDDLYGQTILSSVSRVESYYSCPFQHFATYGLKLSPREEFRLEAPAIGDLFHAALKWISDEMKQRNVSWASLSNEDAWALAKEAVDYIAPFFVHQILLSTKRYAYIQRKLMRILQRTIFSLGKHANVSHFHPIAVEAGFGPGEAMPPLSIALDGRHEMKLRGRIDRIDATRIDGKPYIRIVDYKSSSKKLDMNDVYYGLSLQMLTYLDVAVDHAHVWFEENEAYPAGVLYVHVHNPLLALAEELGTEAINEEQTKRYKMSGLLVNNQDVLRQMDDASASYSSVVPVRFTTNGISEKQSSVVAEEDMTALRHFVRKRHKEAGEHMLAGDTRVLPYRMKNKTACQFCPYRSVCQFDPTDPDQQYHTLRAEPQEVKLDAIRKETMGDEYSDKTR